MMGSVMKKMKPIRCIFGRHAYKPSEIEVYLTDVKDGVGTYRSIAHCVYCGKENEQIFTAPYPWKEENGIPV
jgi:hypothetical protein